MGIQLFYPGCLVLNSRACSTTETGGFSAFLAAGLELSFPGFFNDYS